MYRERPREEFVGEKDKEEYRERKKGEYLVRKRESAKDYIYKERGI